METSNSCLTFIIYTLRHALAFCYYRNIESTKSINAVDGSEVEFNCIAVEANLIVFFVNDTSASEKSVKNKGFIQQLIEDLNATNRRRSLTAKALTKYNNTEVYCRAWKFVDDKTFTAFSETANLLVQGKFNTVLTNDIIHNKSRSVIISVSIL